MHITIHIFVNTVTNRGVVAIDAPVSGVVVRVNRGARCGHAVDELMQCRLVGPVDRPGLYLARGPILRPDDGNLANGTASPTQLIAGVLVALLAAEISLVDLDRPIKDARVVGSPPGPQAGKHEPRRLLPYAEVAVQLHAGHSLGTGDEKENPDDPFSEREVGRCNQRACADTKIRAAGRAPEGHRLAGRHRPGRGATAFRALAAIRPASAFEPLLGGGLVGEHLHYLKEAEDFALWFFRGVFRGRGRRHGGFSFVDLTAV